MNSVFFHLSLVCILLNIGINSKSVKQSNYVEVHQQELFEATNELPDVSQNQGKVNKKKYKPVLVIHGVMSGNKTLESFKERIEMAHPGTVVVIPNNYSNWASLEPLWTQVLDFGDLLMQMSEQYSDGIHLIGYSQGGLIARSILEQYPNHNVKTFISLSSPQGGQYGTKFLHTFFPELVCETAYELFYSSVGQHISVGNYWNDPHHQHLFYRYSTFLPFVNNLNTTLNSYLFKRGLLRLERMVLIGGPNDSVIAPWQSSQFGHFTAKETVVELRDTQVYRQDTLGLRALDEQGRLKLVTVPGVDHYQWHEDLDVIDTHVLPYLD